MTCTVSPRTPEQVRELRAAFIAGVWCPGPYDMTSEVRRRFPMPQITRPRTAVIKGLNYQVRGGVIHRQNTCELDEWISFEDAPGRIFYDFNPSAADLRALASLLENPNETVDAE